MVRPPPITPDKISALLKSYMLKLRFSKNNAYAQVIHVPSSTVACFANTKEIPLGLNKKKTRQSGEDVDDAAIIGKILGERLWIRDITVVSLDLENRKPSYYAKVKVKALLDSLRNVGVKLL